MMGGLVLACMALDVVTGAFTLEFAWKASSNKTYWDRKASS